MNPRQKISRYNLLQHAKKLENEKINTRTIQKILNKTSMENIFELLEEEDLKRFETNGFVVFRFVYAH